MEKKCNKCLESKVFEDFSGSIHNKDGRLNTCLVCMREYSLQYRIRTGITKVKDETQSPKNKELLRIRYNQHMKKRRSCDHVFRFKCNTRSLLYNSFKRACNGRYKKSKRTEEMLGCSLDFFIEYISSLFTTGMTMDNYGSWHIDHKKPMSLCNTEDEILRINHYSNPQPLWKIDNLKKSDSYNI